MHKQNLLVLAPYSDDDLAALESHFHVQRLWLSDDKDGFIAKHCQYTRAIATRGDVGASKALMSQLPALEIVACYGVGVDAIDLKSAGERGIQVTTTPDVLTDDVADMAMALILATQRKILEGDSHVRSGAWEAGAMPLTRSLRGKTIGILGFGRIGQAVAKRAEAFGMAIAYSNLQPVESSAHRFIPGPVELAAAADILVVTVSGGEGTKAMVSADVLKALGPEGTLVNVSRGSAVDEDALIEALEAGHIAGAGLDVFQREPALDPRFLSLSNVVLQPHHSSGTVEARRAMGKLVLDNLLAHFSGRALPTPVQ